jgi:SAM-dependent methyltransferase
MADTASADQVQAAMAYEELLVPALFEEWAPRVASAAGLHPGQSVLDVACGTGVLAREASAWVGDSGAVGLDPHPGMLAVARWLAPGLQWCLGAAEELPFPDGRFDRVISQFGLMFFSDRQQALREMLRVLVPTGRLAVAVWAGLENTPAYASVVTLLERIAGSRAADALRAPFVLGNRTELAELFEAAGAGSITITTHPGTARFPSVRSMVEADLRGWLPAMGVELPEAQIARILADAERILSPYVTPEGTVQFESPAHIVAGTRP